MGVVVSCGLWAVGLKDRRDVGLVITIKTIRYLSKKKHRFHFLTHNFLLSFQIPCSTPQSHPHPPPPHPLPFHLPPSPSPSPFISILASLNQHIETVQISQQTRRRRATYHLHLTSYILHFTSYILSFTFFVFLVFNSCERKINKIPKTKTKHRFGDIGM